MCYKCHTIGHIAPNFPQKMDKSDKYNSSTRKATPKAPDEEYVQREWKKLTLSLRM
jgi:hypothetical protein